MKNTDTALHKQFLDAIDKANATSILLPDDVKLKFYACYKRATESIGLYKPSDKVELRSAFKLNALLQVRKLTKEQAMQKYIELVKTYLEE